MKAFLHHLKFEFFSGLRNWNLLLMYYLLPLAFYLLIGAMMPSINPPFLETLIPAMVCFTVLSGTLLGLPTPLVEAREGGILRSYKVNGVPISSVLLIPALTTAVHLFIMGLFIFITAPLFFKAPLPNHIPAFFFHLFMMIFSLSGLGILIGVASPNSKATILFSQSLYLPSMMISGMMVPNELLPPLLRRIAKILPASHAMEAFRGISPFRPLLFLLIGGIAAFFLSFFLFSWDRKNDPRPMAPAFLVLLPYLIAMFFME